MWISKDGQRQSRELTRTDKATAKKNVEKHGKAWHCPEMSSGGNAVKGTAKAKLHKAKQRNGTEELSSAEAKHCRTEQRRRVEQSGV